MKRPSVQFVLGVITAISIVLAAVYLGLIPGFSGEDYFGPTLVVETASSDGQYVARRVRKSNNRGWCEERTTIDGLTERTDWEREYVFMNECGMPVEMEWTTNRALRISYGYDATGKAHVYRQALSKDRQVAVDYQFNDGGTR